MKVVFRLKRSRVMQHACTWVLVLLSNNQTYARRQVFYFFTRLQRIMIKSRWGRLNDRRGEVAVGTSERWGRTEGRLRFAGGRGMSKEWGWWWRPVSAPCWNCPLLHPSSSHHPPRQCVLPKTCTHSRDVPSPCVGKGRALWGKIDLAGGKCVPW